MEIHVEMKTNLRDEFLSYRKTLFAEAAGFNPQTGTKRAMNAGATSECESRNGSAISARRTAVAKGRWKSREGQRLRW